MTRPSLTSGLWAVEGLGSRVDGSRPRVWSRRRGRRPRRRLARLDFGTVIPAHQDWGMPRGFRGGDGRANAVAHLIERDGDGCWYCGGVFVPGRRARTIDHAVPLALGGTNRLENLRLACGQCNHRKGSLSEEEYRRSRYLAERQRLVRREQLRILGGVLPKSAYHHDEIEWFGEGRWACRSCRLSSLAGTRSPASVPCRPVGLWLHAVASSLRSLSTSSGNVA
jgi:5-methylcytosine-specific restriction endonuclease McrA